jgi:hypothetical protein
MGGQLIPFEVKYRSERAGSRQLKGLLELCEAKPVNRAYVVTKSMDDLGEFTGSQKPPTRIMRIPAPLLCYWMGEAEAQAV